MEDPSSASSAPCSLPSGLDPPPPHQGVGTGSMSAQEMSPAVGMLTPGRVHMLYISMESTIALASVLGNVLVVLVVGVNHSLRDPTFCFIVSLALADIAVGVLVIPLAVVISLGLQTSFHTCLFLSCLLLIITQSSILALLAIAIDRYLRVKIPTRYGSIVTQRKAWLGVCACWLLSTLAGVVPMFGWHQPLHPHHHQQQHGGGGGGGISNVTAHYDDYDDPIECQFMAVMSLDYMVYFNFFGWVVVPLSIMIALYAEIFRVIRRQLERRAEATADAARYYRKELKLAKSLALVVFLFALCWLPLHVMNCVTFFCPGCPVPPSVLFTGILMSHINSALNPLVYAFRIQRFRTTLLHIARRCCVLCRDSGSSVYQSTHPTITEKTAVHP